MNACSARITSTSPRPQTSWKPCYKAILLTRPRRWTHPRFSV
ncbi:hypothetical protein HMPREF9595_02549 [Cutibacterium acnes HL005PA2]|nr:hypothetical protein HMPREF9595_02549 [Cutibacterium acnes HL005PA2]EFT56912.1 hypothetical protein HMPREF9610_00047 [Cutibacterium acnes HL027PA2]EFT79309.1 hypothetical protein HMPREF9601_00430 [Cutibacterium acnes HL030PA1]EGF02844.1 hypothetical protein HMPREF9586_00565 [Cutibacterium acnes HL083PA2]